MSKRKSVPDAQRDEDGTAVYFIGDVLAGGTIIFTIIVLGGSYFVCAPNVTNLALCIAVTKYGLTSFIAHALGLGGIVSVTVQRIRSRGRSRASLVSLNSSAEQ